MNNHILDYRTLDQTPYNHKEDDGLLVNHNAGMFSCSTIALQSLMVFWNGYRKLPASFDRTNQYLYYKHKATDNLIPMLFKESDEPMRFDRQRYMTNSAAEQQFSDYKMIRFDDVMPFVHKYFMPSDIVLERVKYFEDAYYIDYANTCAVFYRNNDKGKETKCASYSDFIDKAWNEQLLGKRFFVIPDELEFWNAWKEAWGNSFKFDDLPLFPHNPEQSIFHQLDPKDLPDHAVNFFAQVLIAAKCKHVLTHSGNGGWWLALYRGNMDNVHQFLNGEWI